MDDLWKRLEARNNVRSSARETGVWLPWDQVAAIFKFLNNQQGVIAAL
jgi:hypothetical protein